MSYSNHNNPNPNNANVNTNIPASMHNTMFINNRTHSTSSSYTSTTSPSNFTSFSYNSPSAHPPSHIFQKNSLSSRSGSIDNLSSSINSNNANNNINTNNNDGSSHSTPVIHNSITFSQNSSFLPSSLTPAGRRSLLTSKLQQQAQAQAQQSQLSQSLQSQHNPHDSLLRRTSNQSFGQPALQPSHISSSYSSNTIPNPNFGSFTNTSNNQLPFINNHNQNQNQLPQLHPQLQQQQSTGSSTSFTPYPTPATATTDISKDLAFSTNSSSSTLYQDAESQFNPPQQQQQQFQQPDSSSIRITHGFNPNSSVLSNNNNNNNHFISASAPAPSHQFSSSVPSYNYFNNQQQQQHQLQKQQQLPPPPTPPTQEQQVDPQQQADYEDHLNIADYPVQELLLMLSALLQKIVEANDLLHNDEENQNRQNSNSFEAINNNTTSSEGTGLLNSKFSANVLSFHGRNIPAISLHAYLTRILKYCPVTNDVFLSLLVYFDRIAKRANNSDHTNEDAIMMGDDKSEHSNNTTSTNNQIFVMDSYNIHRLIISGITVASKFFSDVFYKNSRYAKVGGLPLDELNHLELQFLLLLDFHLMIQKEELERYGDLLLKFWKREQLKRNVTQEDTEMMTD